MDIQIQREKAKLGESKDFRDAVVNTLLAFISD